MIATNRNTMSLKVVSFNIHGFHQGCTVIDDLIDEIKPDLFLLQEHWLTPSNLNTFEHRFSDYFPFGSSAMSTCLESGMLRGRPFGGVITLVSKTLRNYTSTIHCDERFNIVKVFDRLLINVYLKCSGSNNRLLVCSVLLADIWSWRERYSDCECVIARDFNTVMGSNDAVALRLKDFVNSCSLVRCDDLFPSQKVATYVNLSLDQCTAVQSQNTVTRIFDQNDF